MLSDVGTTLLSWDFKSPERIVRVSSEIPESNVSIILSFSLSAFDDSKSVFNGIKPTL